MNANSQTASTSPPKPRPAAKQDDMPLEEQSPKPNMRDDGKSSKVASRAGLMGDVGINHGGRSGGGRRRRTTQDDSHAGAASPSLSTASASQLQASDPKAKFPTSQKRKNKSGPNQKTAQPRNRPTHFLALPLHRYAELRMRIASFQEALFAPHPNDAHAATPLNFSLGFDDHSSSPNEGIKSGPQVQQNVETPAPKPTTTTSPKGKARGKQKPRVSPTIEGLDASIVIDPRRMHMTIGVMALELDGMNEVTLSNNEPESVEPTNEDNSNPAPSPVTIPPKKTLSTALSLLESLKPRISEILDGSRGVNVPLEVMDVLKTTRISSTRRIPETVPSNDQGQEDAASVPSMTTTVGGEDLGQPSVPETVKIVKKEAEADDMRVDVPDKVGAGVLYIAPRKSEPRQNEQVDSEDRRKLVQVCELINKTFKDAGYLTDTRPLTLHCTILNASHRKPPRRIPFSYTDILASPAVNLITASPSTDLSKDGAEFAPLSTITSDGPNELKIDALSLTSSTVIQENSTSQPPPQPAAKPKYRPPIAIPPPLAVNLGVVQVHEVQIWKMGSRGENNEYVSCGGIVLE